MGDAILVQQVSSSGSSPTMKAFHQYFDNITSGSITVGNYQYAVCIVCLGDWVRQNVYSTTDHIPTTGGAPGDSVMVPCWNTRSAGDFGYYIRVNYGTTSVGCSSAWTNISHMFVYTI